MVGGVTSVIGGVGGAAKKAGKTAKTAKAVVKTTAKAGAKEATLAFAEDLGRQVFVDGKSLKEVDYGQSLEAGASAGVTAVIDELDSVLGTKKQLSTTNRKKASQATGVIDDAADAAPRKRVDALPDAEGMPNRGAVKNAAGGLADAGSAGNAGRKSLTKNQNKIQRQTVGNVLSEGSTPKHISDVPSKNSYTISKLEWQEKRGTLTGKPDKLTADERKMIEDLLSSGKTLQIIPKSNVDHVKTPDFLINGVKTELKTLNGSSHNTPIKRIQEGFKQHASTVIIDARKTNLSIDDLVEVISRARGIYNGQLPGEVQFWTNESIYTWTK